MPFSQPSAPSSPPSPHHPASAMLLSEHFTYEELTKSATATRLHIANAPYTDELHCLKKLCTTILEPIREKYGRPIIVTSGYRCRQLNSAIHGARESDHIYGCAADIRTIPDTKAENKKLFNLISRMIQDDEIRVKKLIDEHDYDWIHISMQDGRSSKLNQILHL